MNDDTKKADQWYPSIAMNADGNFVICWQDERNDSRQDIYAQRYSSFGNALGPNFRVNDDYESNWQGYPSIAMDADGDFVICWDDGRNGYDDRDIYAQRFFSDGTPWEANYLINQKLDVPHPNQQNPSVAVNNGRITFAWDDNRRLKGRNIYAKIVTWDWGKVDVPKKFALSQNYPNPFNYSTTIHYRLLAVGGRPAAVNLKVYNTFGQLVRTVVNEKQLAGDYWVLWDGRNNSGKQVASGIYFYRLKLGKLAKTRKMVLLR